MNKERLKELKKEVDELLRCPMSVWNGTGYEEVDELTETGKDLLALIDAALAEPDADAAEAIGELEASLDEDFVVNGRINVFSTYQFKVETIDCIINKLRQYQKPKPSSYAVKRAIAVLGDLSISFDLFGDQPEAIGLAIAALRQMGSAEPCEWCNSNEIRTQKLQKHTNIDFETLEERYKYWTWDDVQRKYCSECGRPLKGGE